MDDGVSWMSESGLTGQAGYEGTRGLPFKTTEGVLIISWYKQSRCNRGYQCPCIERSREEVPRLSGKKVAITRWMDDIFCPAPLDWSSTNIYIHREHLHHKHESLSISYTDIQ